MNVKVNSFNGVQLVPVDSELFSSRMVFLEGEINHKSADEIVKQLLYLSMANDKPISLVINSTGGDIDAGLKICDAVSTSPCPINAYCFGQAFSMSAIIFEAVNGKRFMIGHSRLMLHQPSVSAIQRQTTSDIEELSKQMKEKTEVLFSIVSKKSGLPMDFLLAETLNDRYFDAKESIELQLADECVGLSHLTERNQ